MGLFKKPAAPVDNDDDIRREIRARVAKQAGIYDEEYINTGKIGGKKTAAPTTEVASDAVAVAASHVSAAAVPIAEATASVSAPEPEEKTEPAAPTPPAQTDPVQAAKTEKPSKPAKGPKPEKQKKQPKPPKEKKQKAPKGPRRKSRNIALILFIVALLLSFIPLYYFLTDAGKHLPEISVASGDTSLILSESLLVQGMVSDRDDQEGIKVYYALDNGQATLLYTFESTPGPFEYNIKLPDTPDFVGDHIISLYAEDPKGQLSETATLNFTVAKPALTAIQITTPPSDVKYDYGDKLSLKGLVVTATYEGDTTAQVTEYVADIPDGTKLTESGTVKITITYVEGEVTQKATFTVSVGKKPVVTPATPPRQINSSYPIPSLELYKAGPGAADLQWNPLSGVNGYQIQRKTGSGGSWLTVVTLTSGYTSWTDNGPVAGKTYYYRICSYKVVDGVKVFSDFSSSRSIAL